VSDVSQQRIGQKPAFAQVADFSADCADGEPNSITLI
jgi:hypothetical protein